MDCKDVEKFLYSYIDGELSKDDLFEFESHLKNCSQCMNLFNYEISFKNKIKECVIPQKAPDYLKQKIAKGTEFSFIKFKDNLFTFKTVSAIASVFVIMFFISPSFMGYATIDEENLSDFSKSMQVFSSDSERLSNWTDEQSAERFQLLKYNSNKLKMNPIGAVIKKDNNLGKVPLYFYHYKGEKLMYKKVKGTLNFKDYVKYDIDGKTYYITNNNGFYNVYWKSKNNFFSLTTKLNYNNVLNVVNSIDFQ